MGGFSRSRKRAFYAAFFLLTAAAIFGLFSPAAECTTIYRVNKANIAGGDGSSWAEALNEAEFIHFMNNLGVPDHEFWIAQGAYRPTQAAADQTASFELKVGVALYGGFAGTETAREERDWKAHETILTGDIDEDGTLAENSYHVVVSNSVSSFAVLDGFTITGGNAVGANHLDQNGGGMLNLLGGPLVANCIFRDNHAKFSGGAMANSSAPIIVKDCLFTGNTALTGIGGAISHFDDSEPRIYGCTFSANKAASGGAVGSDTGLTVLVNCTFWSNEATFGGALWSLNSTPEIKNCTFLKNAAAGEGGGMYNDSSNPVVLNSIFWNGSGGEIVNKNGSVPAISFSVVKGGYAGTSNLSSDPLLEDPADNGGPTPTCALPSGSPAVDSGTDTGAPTEDQRGISRPQGAGMDMGAYELVQTAPPPPTPSGSSGGCSSFGLMGGIWLLLPLILLGRK